jgi:glutamate 5-kinase
VASGESDDVLLRLAAGEAVGTLLVPDQAPMAARKQWLADQLQLRGEVALDEGAVRALCEEGKSLLPIGAVSARGDFDRGDLVRCVDRTGTEVARGLINYTAAETVRILGVRSAEIEAILGFVLEPELIHRDNMVVTRTVAGDPP